jgi:hypothetical protein
VCEGKEADEKKSRAFEETNEKKWSILEKNLRFSCGKSE